MRLVIERDGGFTVIESDDVRDIDVRNDGVDIVRRDGDSVRVEREDHAASVALATAIAARCGVMVELLAEQPEVDTDAAMGAASAALIRQNTTVRRLGTVRAEAVREHFSAVEDWAGAASVPPKPASEWVEGYPPRDGRWYVVVRDDSTLPHLQRWEDDLHRWVDAEGWKVNGGVDAHLPTPIPNQ